MLKRNRHTDIAGTVFRLLLVAGGFGIAFSQLHLAGIQHSKDSAEGAHLQTMTKPAAILEPIVHTRPSVWNHAVLAVRPGPFPVKLDEGVTEGIARTDDLAASGKTIRTIARDAPAIRTTQKFDRGFFVPARRDDLAEGIGERATAADRVQAELSIPVKAPRVERQARQFAGALSSPVLVDPTAFPTGIDDNTDLKRGIPAPYLALIAKHAAATDLEERWMLAILKAENAAFDPGAVSPAGAIGLMQVMPAIGAHYGASDLTDPDQNIRVAARFLADLFAKYGNPVVVIGAYNAGEPRIDARSGLPVIPETVDYVSRVTSYYYTGERDNVHPARRQRNLSETDADLVTGSIPAARPGGAIARVKTLPDTGGRLIGDLPKEQVSARRSVRAMSRADRIRETSVVLNALP